ncbi:hypothetical protein, partial [Rhodovulum sulfidophilum]|uniref:hypothetical protein n=1 Tax=Rhodovulum sulfidophilum TaxID=35806 RepID=UPI001F37F549
SRSFATISSGLCLFCPIRSAFIRLESLLQDGQLFWGQTRMPIPPVAVMLAEGLPVLGSGVRCRAGAGGTELAGLLRKT